jgi:L-lactate dehydrogenase complex protein LldG
MYANLPRSSSRPRAAPDISEMSGGGRVTADAHVQGRLVNAAREEILARIRAAGARDAAGTSEAAGARQAAGAHDAAGARNAAGGRAATPSAVDAAYAALPRTYRRAHHDPTDTDIVALFAERAADYRAVVERVSEADLPAAIARVLAGLSRFVVPDGLPPRWLADVGGAADVDGGVDVGGAGGAGAGDWGGGDRVVRDDPPLSARQLDEVAGVVTGCAVAVAETGTIIMDHGPGQGRRILTLVPDFHLVVVRAGQVAADLPDALGRLDPTRPHTLISGPSATSDIELIRVEGVHGPRNLHILVAG